MLLQWAQIICFLFKLWCLCVYIHVCKNVSPCLCEEARRGHWVSSSIIIPLRQEVLSLNLMRGWQSASPQVCLSPRPHRAGTVGASSPVKLYLWALETWTKVLTLEQQELLSCLPATPGRSLSSFSHQLFHIVISNTLGLFLQFRITVLCALNSSNQSAKRFVGGMEGLFLESVHTFSHLPSHHLSRRNTAIGLCYNDLAFSWSGALGSAKNKHMQ